MITTPFLGLKVWNLTTDPYDSAQLAANWQKVDEHDHSNGKGLPIPTAGLQDGAVTGSKVAVNALTTANYQDQSVTTPKLADHAVTTVKLANDGNSIGAGAFSAWKDGATPTTVPSGTSDVVIPLEIENFDTQSWYDITTHRYTPQVKGLYTFNLSAQFDNNGAGTAGEYFLFLYKNGVRNQTIAWVNNPSQTTISGTKQDNILGLILSGSYQIQANGTTDYFQLAVQQQSLHDQICGHPTTFLSGWLVQPQT